MTRPFSRRSSAFRLVLRKKSGRPRKAHFVFVFRSRVRPGRKFSIHVGYGKIVEKYGKEEWKGQKAFFGWGFTRVVFAAFFTIRQLSSFSRTCCILILRLHDICAAFPLPAFAVSLPLSWRHWISLDISLDFFLNPGTVKRDWQILLGGGVILYMQFQMDRGWKK